MGCLVEADAHVRDGPLDAEVKERRNAEAAASAKPAHEGHFVRLWRPAAASGKTVGLCRAGSPLQRDTLLGASPMAEWTHVAVAPLEPYRNDPRHPG